MFGRFISWIDTHPRTMSYIAFMVTLDFLVHILENVIHG
jgi:hypothetical protein